MIGLGLVLVIAVAFGALVATRSVGDRPVGRDTGAEVDPGPARWAAAGILTDEQARAITRFERERRSGGSRVSPAIEALAYVGGVLLTVGAAMLVAQFWDRIGTAGHLGVVGVGAAVAGVVGGVVGEADPVAERLRGFLWALAAGGAGAFVGIGVWEVLDRSGEPVAFAAAATVAVVSASLWRLQDRPLQHALTLAGVAVAIGVGIAWVGSGDVTVVIGAALWLLGALWVGLSWRRLLPPPLVGFALGATLTLIAPVFVAQHHDTAGPVVGLLTAAAWIVAGVAADEGLALVPGVVGSFVFLPWTIGQLFGETLGAPAVVMASGALLLLVVAVLLRRRRGRSLLGGSDLVGRSPGPVSPSRGAPRP